MMALLERMFYKFCHWHLHQSFGEWLVTRSNLVTLVKGDWIIYRYPVIYAEDYAYVISKVCKSNGEDYDMLA